MYGAIAKFSFIFHTVGSSEDTNAIELAIGKLTFIPEEPNHNALTYVAHTWRVCLLMKL